MERSLLLGGAGFLGRHLCETLRDDATEILVADSLHPQIHGDERAPHWLREFDFAGCDVRDASSLSAVIRWFRPTVVYALAAETGTGQSFDSPARHCMTNVGGLGVALECLATLGSPLRRIVLPSSRAVYGEGAWKDASGTTFYPAARTGSDLATATWVPWEADHPACRPLAHNASLHWPRPVSVYGSTKLAQEHVLRSWAIGRGVATSILRLQNVYGPGQSDRNPYTGVLTTFARLARAGRRLPVFEDGGIIRDFVHVSDATAALRRSSLGDADVGPIDVGSGVPVTLFEVASAVAANTPATEVVITGEYRVGDVRAASADISALRNLCGKWSPILLEDGIRGLMTTADAS